VKKCSVTDMWVVRLRVLPAAFDDRYDYDTITTRLILFPCQAYVFHMGLFIYCCFLSFFDRHNDSIMIHS